MGNFCQQYGLPPIAPSRQKGKKHDKSHKSYSHKKYKKYKNNFIKPNNFYVKMKNVSKKYDKQMSSKGKCFNCGKPCHFSKVCNKKPSKLKNKFNMLKINDKEQEELFKILESNNSSDSLEMIFLLHLILAINLLMILLILLILKLVVEIFVVMLLILLILSLRVKKMKN